MAYKSTGVRKETVVFNGYRYNRYPDAKNPAHRRYFARAGHRLHRDVWVFHNGPIPDGYEIHHIDGDTGNNDISNLECMPRKEHRKGHAPEVSARSSTKEHLEHLDSIRVLASEWHGSEEGRAWHREHAKTSLAAARKAVQENGLKDVPAICVWCGTDCVGKSSRKRFCSTRCQTAESKFRLGKSRFEHSYHAQRLRP